MTLPETNPLFAPEKWWESPSFGSSPNFQVGFFRVFRDKMAVSFGDGMLLYGFGWLHFKIKLSAYICSLRNPFSARIFFQVGFHVLEKK